MKSRFKLSFLAIILLYSCGDSAKTQVDGTQEINVGIVFYKNITGSATDPMPSVIKAFIQPIEGGKIPFVPKVTFYRLDLSKDSSFVFKMPMETANSLRKNFGTYDYSNLKDDYNESLPTLQIGTYLTHLPAAQKLYAFPVLPDDISYHLNMNKDSSTQDSIIKDIKNILVAKNQIPKRIVIFYDSPQPVAAGKINKPDSISLAKPAPVILAAPATARNPVTQTDASRITPNNLEKYLNKLANPATPDEEKTGIKRKILTLFTSPDAEVIPVNNGQNTPTGMTIGKYLTAISMTHRIVTVVDKKIEDGKIFEIYISEK